MGISLVVTDKNDKLIVVPEISQKRNELINFMRNKKKTSMLYKGFFLNLVECETVN